MNSSIKLFVTLCFFLSHVSWFFAQSKEKLDDCPTSLEITPLDDCGKYQFTLGEGQSGEDVYWYFDDGTYADHVTYTIEHRYVNHGTYAGYAQYTSDLCSPTTYNFFLIVPLCNTDDIVETPLANVQLFPNPVIDQLYISGLSSQKNNLVELFDLSGKKVLNKGINQQEIVIDLPNYLEGFFIVKITSNGGVIQKRIQVIR